MMSWQDRNVFVTGATGLVGSALTQALLAKGANVTILVRDYVPASPLLNASAPTSINRVAGQLQDQALLERALGEYEIDTVFHLGAQTLVPVANRNPVGTFSSNIEGSWCLLEACRRTPTINAVVVASSDKAYGASEVLPYTEEMPLNALYPYDVSKACTDLIARSYAKTWELPVAITRCGNFFGPGDLNWNRLVPGTIRSLLRGEAPIIRSNGKLTRDYIYVEDAVKAYCLTAEALLEKRIQPGEAYNFSGAETPYSVLALVEEITKIMESPLTPHILNQGIDEIPDQYLDDTKARQTLGWKPRFGIQEGIRETIAWYKALLA